jgi:predicted acetyltransferase
MARGEVELEVGTVPQQRGKGLAVIVCRELIKQCQHLGIEPVYTCTSNNLPSVAVAHKLGYAEVEEVLGYELPRDE